MSGQVHWVTLACLLLSVLIECKPQHRWSSTYGSVVGAGSSEPAFSASSYDSLGIQPTRLGRNQQPDNNYWWQGPKSPFSEGAAQTQGISNRPQTVVGCSGDGCSSPLFSGPLISASSASSSSNSGGNCCNHYWQKPDHPCSTHQGNDCPRSFSCVNYRSCSNGVISLHASSGYASQRPSVEELMNYGRPCGFSGREVCCQDAPQRPQQPVVQQPLPPQTYYPPAQQLEQQPVIQQPSQTYYPPSPPAPATQKPVYYPPPVYSPAPPAYQPPAPTPAASVYEPPTPTPAPPPPVYQPPAPTPAPPAYYPPAPTPAPPVYQPPAPTPAPPPPVYQPPAPSPTPAPPAYQPPPPPVFTPAPPAVQTPRPPPPTQPVEAAQGPPANLLPYPGCAAALKCVLEEYCSIEGIMIDTPVFLTSQQKEYRVPLMACLNTETNQIGFCCRDPLYNDPWPAGMPMPAMPAKPPPVQPVVQEPTTAPPPPPTQPPFIQCYPTEDCVPAHVCSSRQQPFNNLPNARCQSPFDGQVGVCCSRPPPPPPTTIPTTTQPPFIQCYPTEDCVPPHVCSARQQPFINLPNARCQSPIDGQAGVCCNRPPPPPPTTTAPPPPPPPVEPVVAPSIDYLPPPPPPPVEPVVVPSIDYLPPPPPPPPTTIPTTTQPPFIQCYPTEDCVQPHVCSSRQQPFNNQPNARCQSPFDGQIGVCCNRPPPTTTAPPPPPPTQPVVVPDLSYLPPPVEILPPPQQQTLPPSAPVIDYVPPPAPEQAAQVNENQCGISRPVSQLLENGEAALGEYPWHAMITQLNGSMTCSGALIGPKFVATSFHCVQGIIPTNLRVRLGEQRVGSTDEPLPHYEIPVTAVVGHPDFAEGSLFHDTAVLMLAAAAPSGQAHIAPICLPEQSDPQVSQCVVSGWGHDTLSGLQSGMLNKVQVDIVRNQDCQNSLQSTHLGKYFKLHKSFTCASTQNSINPCKVDGGSPLACKRPDGSHVLMGLSSWSVGCSNQQQPGVYADVMSAAPWMQQEMAKPEASLVEQSNSAFQTQQQFQSQFGAGAGYGR